MITIIPTDIIGFTAKNELVATTHCFCPGLEFNYFNCTVIGGLFTVWKGSAFNDGCEITLPHINFNTGTATGSCNNRAITAQGIRGENDCYTSQLTIRPSISLQGVTVECAVNDNSGEMTIGHIVLNFTQSKLILYNYY